MVNSPAQAPRTGQPAEQAQPLAGLLALLMMLSACSFPGLWQHHFVRMPSLFSISFSAVLSELAIAVFKSQRLCGSVIPVEVRSFVLLPRSCRRSLRPLRATNSSMLYSSRPRSLPSFHPGIGLQWATPTSTYISFANSRMFANLTPMPKSTCVFVLGGVGRCP